MLTATALVLFMTIPGLALFYGGLVRTKNALSVLMQCFALTALITLLWLAYGYSVAFSTDGMQAGAPGCTPSSAGSTRRSCAVSGATRSPGRSPSRSSSPTR